MKLGRCSIAGNNTTGTKLLLIISTSSDREGSRDGAWKKEAFANVDAPIAPDCRMGASASTEHARQAQAHTEACVSLCWHARAMVYKSASACSVLYTGFDTFLARPGVSFHKRLLMYRQTLVLTDLRRSLHAIGQHSDQPFSQSRQQGRMAGEIIAHLSTR